MIIRRRIFTPDTGEFEATIAISTSNVLEGYLPPRALNLVQERGITHRGELLEDWRLW